MTTILQTSEFNTVATLNTHFSTALAAYTLPSWLSAPALIADWPEIEGNLPCISIVHIGVDSLFKGQASDGTYKVSDDTALMELSAWASRSNVNWPAQLRTMSDIIHSWAVSNPTIVIRDYAANVTAPSATPYVVRLFDPKKVATEENENPDIKRTRWLIEYRWHYRAA